ncbi:MAG TPA: SOS response-associated peptidase [Rubrobacteraceae bacterium]|nr:SOS response-associated peptidase [Rubrobacteraceae bacterium]
MCGRYTLKTPLDTLVKHFGLTEYPPRLSSSYNIAPTQLVAAVTGSGRLETLRWGLIPSWARDDSIGARLINARAETVNEKPSFRSAFRRRRCLIPADGFYEWRRSNGGKQPYYITVRGGEPFAFAGIRESWSGPEEEVHSCAIITTRANPLVAGIHDRMPVILPPDAYDPWLDPEAEAQEAISLLEPFSPDEMDAYPVSARVNRPANNDERCVQPL